VGNRLAGKVAFVTGGGGGIGEATVRLFWEEGARVAVVDNDLDAAQAAARNVDPSGERVLAVGADLTQEAEAERAVQETVKRFGRLDILVNVAGVRVWGPITEATPESWKFILDVNLLATAYAAKFAIPELAKNGGGSIVNVSSANAIVGRKGMAQYDASKNAILALTRSMACDHAEQGLRVNAICPGPTLTMYHVRRRAAAKSISLAEAEAELRAAGAPATLLKRQAEPREIAYGTLFLASDEASYVTGATIMVDGGLSV
jgi:NAD(P)-dependent dehydrogenase (short-subunit alcohol dehydrogenase family)